MSEPSHLVPGTNRHAFPFDAVVGQEDAKLALRLAARNPLIGGVLLRGQKGSAKTTLARGLAAMLGDAPFVDLPLGATEERVVGTLDARAALIGGEIRFEPGLLARAHGGVLYVDEINLLADHLVDVLLDVAVSGENVVERDGISHRHPARFVLVGSMNPEEGELRPQLLDRFGFCVEVTAPVALDERVEAVRRRLAFDAGEPATDTSDRNEPFWAPDIDPDGQPQGPERLPVSEDVIEAASRLALGVGAEGLRADLTLCRAASALAALEGRVSAHVDDLRRVAPLVLAHRSRRGPFDPPVVPPSQLEESVNDVLDEGGDPASDDPASDDQELGDEGSGDTERPWVLAAPRRPPHIESTPQRSPRGRVVRDEPAGSTGDIAVVPTIRAVANRRSADPDAPIRETDLRSVVRVAERSRTIVLCVDLSGSMGAPQRAQAASGTVLGLLTDAYERRHKVGLVTFRGDQATTVLAPTRSIEIARNRLDGLVTGGETPLALGLSEALRTAERGTDETSDALIAVLTDGRATGRGGFDAAVEVASAIARSRVDAVVLDCETGRGSLGLASELAIAMGARHIAISDLETAALTRAVQSAAGLRR